MNEKNTQNVIPNVNFKKKEERNVPDLRFSNFQSNLRKISLSDIFNISAGGDIDKSLLSPISQGKYVYPVIANALTNDGIHGYTTKYKFENTLTVTGRGDVGIAKERTYKYYPIVRLLTLQPKEIIDLKYFECLINSRKILIESTGVPQLTSPQLSKEKYFICNYDEQRKIGETFRIIDQRISTQKKIIEKIETQIYLISHAMVTLISQVVPLNDICFFESKTKHQSGDGLPKGTYPFFTNEEETIKYFNSYDFDGEYIIANTGGKANFKYFAGKFASMSDCLVIGFKNQSLTYFYSIVFSALQNYIDYIGFEGSGLKHLNKEWLLKLNVPQYSKQAEKFICVIKSLKRKLENEKDMLVLYKKQKAYLLQNMFI